MNGGQDILGDLGHEVSDFCRDVVPTWLKEKVAHNRWIEKDEYLLYYRLLAEHGLLVGHWPRSQGGRAWSVSERMVFERETALGNAPWLVPMAVGHVGPVLCAFGTPAQQDRFLPGIRSADVWWSQGYSEPGAGSDLASLRTRAVRDGDSYVVSGQKIWTSYAHWGDWLYCLVRTSDGGRPQEGISFLLIDLKSPGIVIRPIVSMDMMHHLNEVFFDDVRVPAENLIGGEGQGWTIAKFLLDNERILVAEPGKYQRQINHLKNLHSDLSVKSQTSEHKEIAWRIAELELRLFALNALLATFEEGPDGQVTQMASMVKIRGSKLEQDILETMYDCLGAGGMIFEPANVMGGGFPAPFGPVDADGIIREHLYTRATTIFGGTSEIQYNILARSMVSGR